MVMIQVAWCEDADRSVPLPDYASAGAAGADVRANLPDRGRLELAPGARAHITVYRDQANRERMFERPEYVFKDGREIVRNGRVTEVVDGATHVVHPEYDSAMERDLDRFYDRHMTVRKDNVRIADDEIRDDGRGELVVHGTRRASA